MSERELTDPGRCPYTATVRCVKRVSENGPEMIVMNNQRHCESCGWGPNRKEVKAYRLAVLREKLRKAEQE